MLSRSEALAPEGRAVLVTGASTGLGRAAALHLDRLGFQVYAGIRRAEDGELLAAESPRLEPVYIDITDEKSVASAAALVQGRGSGLWGLVNNAGTCVSAPLECVTPAQLRHQLDTGVVGHLAVTRAVLPLLRERRGRIVNVSSGLGSVAVPFLGAYATAQFAKEGLSDALRRELAPTGVAVSIVQPGAIMTPIWKKTDVEAHRILDGTPGEIAELYRRTFLRFLSANEQRARSSRTTPADFARTVAEALTAARPKIRYRVGRDARVAEVVARRLPAMLVDRFFRGVVTDS